MRRKKVEELYVSPTKTYSFAFKQKVVKEVESGVFNKDGARRRYGIEGKTTILNWYRRYGVIHQK